MVRALAVVVASVAVTALVGVVGACGGASLPEELGGNGGPHHGADASSVTPPLVQPGAGVLPPLCTMSSGDDAGICDCVDQAILTDVPNIYFVLDRSGSMTDKWTTVRTVLAHIEKQLGPRIAIGAAVFPDPTVQDGCAPGVEVMPVRQGDSPTLVYGPTTNALAAALDIGASGGTPTAATLQSLLPHLQSLAAGKRTYVVIATDGGPNCNPRLACSVDQCEANIEGAQGCVPNTPPNCCDLAIDGPLTCLDAAASVQAVAAIAAAGIPVYVVGLPGSPPYAALLDQMATAGGTAQSGPNAYYAVDMVDALDAAISSIAAKIAATCTLPLAGPPADPGLVNVFLDEQVLPEDPVNGWRLDGATVTILGSACADVLAGKYLDVRVIAGCPTVLK
jgi:hypothetical protein